MITQVCAWCQKEGIQTILAWGDEPGESHGACEWHGMALVAEAFNLALAKRFLAHIDHSGPGCWLWTGRVNSKGYGLFDMKAVERRRHRPELAHRVMWWLIHGEYVQQDRAISDPHCILHECDVPNCVRPAHLRRGTITSNNRDAGTRGRFSTSARRRAASENNKKWWSKLSPQERKDEANRRFDRHQTELYAEAFENYLKTHPHETEPA